MENKLQQSLGLAQRAGKCVSGEELIFQIEKRKIHLVLIATNASERTKNDMMKKCERFNVPYIESLTKEDLSNAIGKFNRVAVGITDVGFSKLLKSY